MLRRFLVSNLALRRYASALYVTGDKAKENCAVLTPYLNFEERLSNFQEIQENVKRRKLSTNLNDFKSEYELFLSLKERRKSLEDRRVEIVKLIRESKEDSAEGLKIQGAQIREDLKLLKEQSYHIEDCFVHNYLALPNVIHNKTPESEKIIIHNFKECNLQASSSGIPDELIEFYDPTCYYMKGEAAKFDLFFPMQVLDHFKERNFIPFSNPDFARSIIAEGAGIDPQSVFLLKEDDIENKFNLLHLTGSASFVNYLSFITKLSTFPTLFPFKYVCIGKQYDARNHYDHQNLYKAVQATCCQTFVATADATSFDDVINEQIQSLIQIYEPFNQHFRIVGYPADQLSQAESFKLGVEMYSSSQSSYVEVGNFSYYGDYISKRLLFNYKIGKDFHFPHIYSGTAVNALKLLLILIENNKEFKCPEWQNE